MITKESDHPKTHVICLADCGFPDYIDKTVPEMPKIPIATNGEVFPWDDVRFAFLFIFLD